MLRVGGGILIVLLRFSLLQGIS